MKTPRERVIEAAGRLEVAAGRLAAGRRAQFTRIERTAERILDRLKPALALDRIDRERARLQALAGLLDSFSYARVLERGFVLVRDARDAPVTAAAEVTPGMSLHLRFHDGERQAIATDGRQRSKAKPADADTPQGSLL
jgi:exodeoxyribonuclease VII large subunit